MMVYYVVTCLFSLNDLGLRYKHSCTDLIWRFLTFNVSELHQYLKLESKAVVQLIKSRLTHTGMTICV